MGSECKYVCGRGGGVSGGGQNGDSDSCYSHGLNIEKILSLRA